MERHRVDPFPSPKGKKALYVDEQWMVDESIVPFLEDEMPADKDNIRIYFPVNINRNAILRRLDHAIFCHGKVTDKNEYAYSINISQIIAQFEIYDQIWASRRVPDEGDHCPEVVSLAKEILAKLETIPCKKDEMFPNEYIELFRDFIEECENGGH